MQAVPFVLFCPSFPSCAAKHATGGDADAMKSSRRGFRVSCGVGFGLQPLRRREPLDQIIDSIGRWY